LEWLLGSGLTDLSDVLMLLWRLRREWLLDLDTVEGLLLGLVLGLGLRWRRRLVLLPLFFLLFLSTTFLVGFLERLRGGESEPEPELEGERLRLWRSRRRLLREDRIFLDLASS
jgi:hypothetical protein